MSNHYDWQNFEVPSSDEVTAYLESVKCQNKQAELLERALDYGGMLFAFALMLLVFRAMIY